LFYIKRIFVAASLGRFDDYLNDILILWVFRREMNRVRKAVTLPLWHWWNLSIAIKRKLDAQDYNMDYSVGSRIRVRLYSG
jgi:hypothetical protein